MKTQQEWVKDILFSIISLMKTNQYNGDINDEGYRYTINGALDNYSQTYWYREKGKNISLYHKYNKFDEHIYRNVLMSKNAFEIMKNNSQNRNLNKELHGEHMTPQSYTRKKLNELLTLELTDEELREKIQHALSDAKLCIITKDESKILDGAENPFSEEEIIDFLNVYASYKKYKSINDIPDDIKSDFTALPGKSKRSNGFGSIRLYILLKNNVVFVNEKDKTQTFEECMKYLKDGNYYI
ncbi:hypothetical protein [uncultured Solobacterium sp.]|jgi:hypothetical protein|uniref:hypothetical protein n=1 Tax=uncultured Solobacterium sp. TaxID=747375 RepID=UPI0025CE7A4E|nr:hypothetical protein [uncultured Solobacterium sp.]